MELRIFHHILGLVLVLLLFSHCSNDATTAEQPAQNNLQQDPIVKNLDAQIKENPEQANLYAARARYYYDQEGFDEAINDLEIAISKDSMNADYFHALADVYLDYFKSKLAVSTMQRAASRFPERIPTLLKLSEFHVILKQYDEAANVINQILQKDPLNGNAYYMKGMIFNENDQKEKAINAFQTSVELDPDILESWIILGDHYTEQNDPIATKYYNNAIRVDSTYIQAYHSKAIFLTNQEKLNEAIAVYKQINLIDSQYPNAYYNAGILYMEMDSVEKALDLFNITVKVDPIHLMGYFYRGLAAEALGDPEAAAQDFQHVLNLAPKFERALTAMERIKKLQ